MSPRRHNVVLYTVTALALAVCASASRAIFAFNIYTVGQGCAYSTIQDAVDAAAASPGEDYVWIVNNKIYTSQHISIVDQDVDIEGGFSDCSDFSIGPNDYTTVYGTTQPVFSISGNSHVYLSNLMFLRQSYDGGGVNFTARAASRLRRSRFRKPRRRSAAYLLRRQHGPATTLLDGTNNIEYGRERGGFSRRQCAAPARSTSFDRSQSAEIGGGSRSERRRADLGITNGYAAESAKIARGWWRLRYTARCCGVLARRST